MKRAIQLLVVLGLATALAGCDKCGDPVKFFQPKSCGQTGSSQ